MPSPSPLLLNFSYVRPVCSSRFPGPRSRSPLPRGRTTHCPFPDTLRCVPVADSFHAPCACREYVAEKEGDMVAVVEGEGTIGWVGRLRGKRGEGAGAGVGLGVAM